MHNTPNTIKILYDGRCYLCSFEISYYLKKDIQKRLEPIDITTPEFKAENLGLDPVAVQRRMHVILPQGEVKIGVDAFIEIWKVIPGSRFLAKVVNLPIIKTFAKLAYDCFALGIRPYLPKKKTCDLTPRQ